VLRERPRGTPAPAAPAGAALADPDEPRPLEFKEGSRALFLGAEHYGCTATVLPDRNRSIGAAGQASLPPAARRYCVRVQPLPPGADNAARAAKRVMLQHQVRARCL
jgi:hypothetical protein